MCDKNAVPVLKFAYFADDMLTNVKDMRLCSFSSRTSAQICNSIFRFWCYVHMLLMLITWLFYFLK